MRHRDPNQNTGPDFVCAPIPIPFPNAPNAHMLAALVAPHTRGQVAWEQWGVAAKRQKAFHVGIDNRYSDLLLVF